MTSTKIAELATEHLSQGTLLSFICAKVIFVALKIYKELSHERQVAATHFHLAEMFTSLHQSSSAETTNDSSKPLKKSMNSNHYLAAALSHYRCDQDDIVMIFLIMTEMRTNTICDAMWAQRL